MLITDNYLMKMIPDSTNDWLFSLLVQLTISVS